ncbi:MAG: four-carbon acid sugar kinase family protein [Armatimonadota bacterium]
MERKRIEENRSNLERIGIIADDLTGALDTAVQFTAVGLTTFTVLNHSRLEAYRGVPVLSVSTESRPLPPLEAAERVRRAAVFFSETGRFIYKKIDSLLRGNVAAEVLVVGSSCKAVPMVAPAFPAQKRLVRGGEVFVDGFPLSETMGKDGGSGAAGKTLVRIFEKHCSVGLLPLSSVRRGVEEVCAAVEKMSGEVLIADAETDDDLLVLAKALLKSPRRLVPCGSAGLAAALSRELEPLAKRSCAHTEFLPQADRVFVVAGSQSSVTARQISALTKAYSVEPTVVLAVRLWGDEWDAHARDTAQDICAKLRSGRLAVLVLTGGNELLARLEDPQKVEQATELIAFRLGVVGAEVVREAGKCGLVLTGGATAKAVLNRLGVEALRVVAQVEPGVPVSSSVGGVIDGSVVVTKAGAFGDENTLVRAVGLLRRAVWKASDPW